MLYNDVRDKLIAGVEIEIRCVSKWYRKRARSLTRTFEMLHRLEIGRKFARKSALKEAKISQESTKLREKLGNSYFSVFLSSKLPM